MNRTMYFAHDLGLLHPIIQAPMAGGATTPELVAAVSNAGGLGSFGFGYASAKQMQADIKRVRELSSAPFAANVFLPAPHQASEEQIFRATNAINYCASELSIKTTSVAGPYSPIFDEQLQVLLGEAVPIVSFTFGVPSNEIIKRFKKNNTVVMGTATTLEEAQLLEEAEVDAIVLQGSEAGGHRGSFLVTAEDSLVPLNVLLEQASAEINIPLIAAGGIMDGTEITSVLNKGAAMAQLGTAFLTCHEAGIPSAYKSCLLAQEEDNTVLTRAFSGKLARGINNRFIECMTAKSDTILDYPIQNKLTGLMRSTAKEQANTDYMSLWAGQAVHQCRNISTNDLLVQLVAEMDYCDLMTR